MCIFSQQKIFSAEQFKLKSKGTRMLNNSFKLSKYRFTLEALDNISLPAYKGSTFHGGIGHALMQISPIWYRYFYEPQQGWPKPYVILPPLDEQEHYPKGQQFTLEITLIGEATQHYAIMQAAVEYLGLRMGLGYEQGKYKITNIEKKEFIKIENHQQITALDRITVSFPTRLRLKHNNRLLKQTPNFNLFTHRLVGRIKTLQKAYLQNDLETNDYQEMQKLAEHIKIQHSNIHWDDWDRFSGSQKKWMKFGGLIGEITYGGGDLKPFIEILKLGEWLHIGGKTSFGLGKYTLSIN